MDSTANKTATDRLSTPVQYLKGVGPSRAELLARLELKTARDVLFCFPRDYQDMSELRPMSELQEGATVSVTGTVEEVDLGSTGIGKSIFGAIVRQGNDCVRAVWFNQPYMQRRLWAGLHVMLSGLVRKAGLRWEMVHPKVQILDNEAMPQQGTMFPVYPLTEGLKQAQMRRIVQHVVEACANDVEEVLPDEFLDQHHLWPIRAALPQVHFPSDPGSLQQARRRFVYQELLVLQLALALRRQLVASTRRARPLVVTPRIDARIRRLFPFELTQDQQQAIGQIAADMQRDVPMNRLLQGDVASGKTVVAAYAMLLCVAHAHQAALMTPTEILARQHEETLKSFLAKAQVRVGVLTGALTVRQRKDLLAAIEAGQIDLVIGTHAMLQEEVRFQRLSLVVIDEQHKFGVRQRAQLRQAGMDPHYLVMTATPIPRTVAMTLFGDLDVSTLRECPPGRQPVHTYLAAEQDREKWWDFFRRKLGEGRQGYVITPLVDPSEHLAVGSVEDSLEALSNGPLEAFRLGLVHGRMSSDEKVAAMHRFRSGQTQVLVATSVVEVGVDVPNANLMTVENGERFGLAQLHQLRGRIGRGSYPGYFCVFSDAQTPEALSRLNALVGSSDGFELAEIDFQLRGPGHLLGTEQHGLPPLRVADLIRDHDIAAEARSAAQELVASDPELADPRYAKLRAMVLRRYGKQLELGDVA